MASKLDYEALRAQTMGAGSDEAVTVNTRALIDKVLARYSGEWTTLRELLQNAADASATNVSIRFQTLPSPTVAVPQSADPSIQLKHVLLHHTLKSLMVENNGKPFQATDWSRLKKIAEGNPDETKIGAFGVGFYSVFADCEEPFVSSGKEALAFYWKGDSLFTRKLQLEATQSTNTTFVLPMRNFTSPVPSLFSLCQFLAGSLTFVGLESVELWLDDWKIIGLNKFIAPPASVAIPQGVEKKTQEGLMQVNFITHEAAQLDARWLKAVEWRPKSAPSTNSTQGATPKIAASTQSLRSFFSRLAPGANNVAAEKAAKEESALQNAISEDLLGESKATIFLHVNRANINTLVTKAFSHELERATKKPPPYTTTVSFLTTSYDENKASTSIMTGKPSKGSDIFSSVVPTRGRIFIGFPTNQTTGLNAHISTPSIIPTVERESIDLNNRFVRSWNVELLRVAGILARVAWSRGMADIKLKMSSNMASTGRKQLGQEDIARFLPEASFLHKTFDFAESTPFAEVVNIIEEAFWTCNKTMSIDMLSSCGVLQSSHVRIATEELGFVDGIPTLPGPLAEFGLVKRLRDYGVITEITISDIKSELEKKALNVKQLGLFLEWIGNKAGNNKINSVTIRSLLGVAIANDDEEVPPKLLVLGDIKNYLNVSRIPAEMPVPPSTMLFKYTKKISKTELNALGWEDLQMVPWLRWLLTGGCDQLTVEQNIEKSEPFARAVLPVISKQFDGLSQSSKATVIDLLASRTIIPTKLGMRKPVESYFPSVNLFGDLPVISSLQSVKEKFLIALGVRKTIEIGVVLERLKVPSATSKDQSQGKWSHVDLIKYLASVHNDIPPDDVKRLKSTPFCLSEARSVDSLGHHDLVSNLFEPNDSLRRLKLPILQWPGDYQPSSAEGRFLTHLGLRSAPTYLELVEIMYNTRTDLPLRDYAFRYFIENHHTKGYDSYNHSNVSLPYLPLQGQEKLEKPSSCFTNERVAIMGFSILRRDLHQHAAKFGVRSDPPMQECINRLIINPPRTSKSARELFEYFASRPNEIDQSCSEILSNSSIVPVFSKSTGLEMRTQKVEPVRHIPPRICFLGTDKKYAGILDYVDFGQLANTFLLHCGSKHEPNISELGTMLMREPARIFTLLEIPRYTDLLRHLAQSWPHLKNNKGLVKQMRTVKFLLAHREHPSSNILKGENIDDEDDQSVRTAELASASQIVVVDDNITYKQFKTSLLVAPFEDVLEEFYFNLGSPELGSLVQEHHSIGVTAHNQNAAYDLQKLIQERTRLFLHDLAPDLIKHDAKWIDENLSVIVVKSISLRKTLKGHSRSHNESRSAAVHSVKDGCTLSVTPKFDLFEVSQVLVPLLVNRSRMDHTLVLESLLSTDLLKLQARGYNVQRILRRKAQEAQVAEDERNKQLAQEAQDLKDQEKKWNEEKAQKAAELKKQQSMPGLFPDSPDHKQPKRVNQLPPPEEDRTVQRPRGFFSDIGKRLGLENGRHPLLHNRPNNNGFNEGAKPVQSDSPPPYSQEDLSKIRTAVPQPETVTAPHHLQQNLMNAIQASRAHNSSTLISKPAVNEVKETRSYCDSRPGQNITYIGEIASTRVFLSNTVNSTLNITAQEFLAANASALGSFAEVLLDCASLFGLKRESLHIYYDEKGSTIAFNQNKALFFNYRYYENLHLPKIQQGRTTDAVVYWYVVMAHELAHNLVEDHSADHSYYTEALIIQYFTKIAAKISSQNSPESSQLGPSISQET